MATDILIPNVGESVTSGVIARWNKNDGELVKRDEPVLELETDKVTLEVPAPASGVLRTRAKVGDEVQIGAVVGQIEESAAQPAAPATAGPTPTAAASASAASDEGGRTPGIRASADTANVATPVHRDGLKETATVSGANGDAGEIRATPLARKLAEERGIDLARITGSGAGGRIREQDVLAFAQGARAGTAAPTSPPPAPALAPETRPAAPAISGDGRAVTRERMTPLRQRVASRLVEAQHTAAMLTTFNECDMTAVMELRKQFKEDFERRHGVGLGFMSFFVKAAVAALQAYPMVNAFIVQDENGAPAIEKHDYCDVALAVASPKGLVVPVLRNCERLSFAQIESGVKDLALRARDGKLTLDEMQGGTFTITNGGIFGSLMSTPILNPPQSAILGMHAIKNRPVEHPAGSGQVAVRPMMYLALSYDHRIIDGAEAVRFLVKIKECIEDPTRLLLGV